MNSYFKSFYNLKENYSLEKETVELNPADILIRNFNFHSEYHHILPGCSKYRCAKHNLDFPAVKTPAKKECPQSDSTINTDDAMIMENQHFRYSMFAPMKQEKTGRAIILLHGLNERNWDKYLTWAQALCEKTRRPVILFPIAFHMNRAPKSWSIPKVMHRVSKKRQAEYPAISSSTYANAAISTRLQSNPQRYTWSGLQSYYDIMTLVKQIRSGTHPYLSEKTEVDFFSYSIGVFLTLILLMTDADRIFQNSRMFAFCGGCVLNRCYPTSRFIMDSEANIAIYSFYIEQLDKEIERDPRLKHFFSSQHPEGMFLKSMLDFHKLQDLREKRLKEISRRIQALALAKDDVMPVYEVEACLRGHDRKVPVKVRHLDFPYIYTHENPFPINEKLQKKVEKAFEKTFKIAGKFLS